MMPSFFLRSYDQLSDGQKYRYRIAKLLETKAKFWLLDEFAATLDRDTAKIVSFNLQKVARAEGKCVIAATTHTDLFTDLNPSVHIHKRYGKEITVNYYQNEPAKECSLVREMRVEEGSAADWRSLSVFHYRSHRTPAPRRIFCLKRWDELCGVIVYSYPAPAAFGRRLVLPNMSMKELNVKLSAISRVVVHPKYRTIGLGVKLVRETLALAGTPYVEMSAVMAKYNPFAEKAGMKKVVLQPPSMEVRKVACVLEELGFDCQLLSSEKYVAAKLAKLSKGDLAKLKQAFIMNRHPRFLKAFSFNMPYGTGDAYRKAVQQTDPSKFTHLIKICGFLMQTKGYLFWKNT
jgi:energy-coupling factor transporter ATP-binding protein EcfA2